VTHSLSFCLFSAIREELLDLRYRRGRQPSEDVLEIFEGIDVQSVASLDQDHVSHCGENLPQKKPEKKKGPFDFESSAS